MILTVMVNMLFVIIVQMNLINCQILIIMDLILYIIILIPYQKLSIGIQSAQIIFSTKKVRNMLKVRQENALRSLKILTF